jgi:thiol-disulfide isomerase/thioredoxin
MKNYNYSLLLFFITCFNACDIIEPPFVEEDNTENIDTTEFPVPSFTSYASPIKKILIEDFTGHKCVNCPEAHEIAAAIQELYPEQVEILAIHAGFFAKTDNDKYAYDFNTDVGTELNEFFETNDAFPIGMVSRKEINGSYLIAKDSWSTVVDTLADNSPLAYIQIINDYHENDRRLGTHVNAEFLSDLNGQYMLAIYLVEDSIIATQKSEDENGNAIDDENYIHKNVLRDDINGSWGDTIVYGAVSSTFDSTMSYAFTVNEEWDENNCFIIAFLYDYTTKEILQVEREKIVE